MVVLLALLSVFCLYAGQGDALRCYNCEDSPHPRDCLDVIACSPGDHCYTEEVVTGSGDIVYHSGCLPGNRCPASSSPVIGKRSGDITLCIDCCQGDFCNNKGCGTVDIPQSDRGPYCFKCDATWEGHLCNKVITCAENEVCAIHTPRDYFSVPEVVYESSCLSKTTCSALQNAYINTKCVPTCCETDYCNTHCNKSSPHLTPAPTVPHHTATTQPPTVPTQPPTTTTTTASQCPSDHDYDQQSGLCINIVVVAHPVSWYKAQDACSAMGETLVSIDSHQKTAFIDSLIQGSHVRWYWIGGRDQYDTSTFYWSNGKKFDYTNWGGHDDVAPNQQPDDGPHHKQNCVGIYNKDYHRWHDHHCYTQESAYICEHAPNITPLIMPFICDTASGYIDLGGGLCVHIHRDKRLDWNHARTVCHHEETELVVLDTPTKYNTLNTYLDRLDKTHSFWIGGQDLHKNDKFYWVTGEPFKATNWYIDPHGTATQPSHLSSTNDPEDCVVVYPYPSTHHMWHDDQCKNQRMFICQRT